VIYFKKCELRITDLNLISKILTHVENPDFQTSGVRTKILRA
jgi:hypothetical protein